MMRFKWLSIAALMATKAAVAQGAAVEDIGRPNILILYADDLGYGDPGCYNPESKIPTPMIDRLAREGMRFLDGHSSSGICTPSRYAMLTGRYHWRKFHRIVGALGPSSFDTARLTLPEMLREQGYRTACIGKWHLGWDWPAIRLSDAKPVVTSKGNKKRTLWPHDAFDWSKPVPDGPLAHGFDYYFGDAVINFPPYAWIENDRLVQPPDTTLTITQSTKEGNWEARPGPARSDWNFYENLPTLTEKATTWLEKRKGDVTPFFLYFPLPSPHAPIIPTDKFDGRSQAGAYGDYVVQSDWSCGQLLDALERAGHAENTLVVFTADNGPEKYAYARDEKLGHWSSGPLRGLKRDIYEGGHRVPFVVRWPGVVEPGSVSDAVISQIDLMATIAAITGYSLPNDAAEDSFNQLPVLRGGAGVRTSHVHNTFQDHYAIRLGDWVLVDAKNGYHSGCNAKWEERHDYPTDDDENSELYRLTDDLGQRHNLICDYPEKVKELRLLLQQIQGQGHSAPRLVAQAVSGG